MIWTPLQYEWNYKTLFVRIVESTSPNWCTCTKYNKIVYKLYKHSLIQVTILNRFLQLNNIQNSKQLSVSQQRSQSFHYKHQAISIRQGCNLENYHNCHQRVQLIINRYLRNTLPIHWTDTISNNLLYPRTDQDPAEQEFRGKRWWMSGYT